LQGEISAIRLLQWHALKGYNLGEAEEGTGWGG